MKKRALFVDRDGTITYPVLDEHGIPRSHFYSEEFKLMPGVMETLGKIHGLGFLAILITNQPDIAYGNISRDEWEKINSIVKTLPLDDIYICFHRRDEECSCKKPRPGMITDAAKKWDIDLSQSYLVGDTYADTGAAKNAGMKSILIDAPYNKSVESEFRVTSFADVIDIVKKASS